MAITPNSSSFNLALIVDYVADTLAELEANANLYLNSYVLIRDTEALYRVSYDASINDTQFTLVPYNDPDTPSPSDSIVKSISFSNVSVVRFATETVISNLFTITSKLKNVIVSGDGDALIKILINATELFTARLNIFQPTLTIPLQQLQITAGQTVTIQIECIARSTSTYNGVLIYE